MNKAQIKKVFIQRVYDLQGCKATELVTSFSGTHPEVFSAFDREDLFACIEELVKEGELVQVVYALSGVEFKKLSFLLPGGTIVPYMSEKDKAEKSSVSLSNGPNQALLNDIGEWESKNPGIRIRWYYHFPDTSSACTFYFEYEGEPDDATHKFYKDKTWEAAFDLMMKDLIENPKDIAKRLILLKLKCEKLLREYELSFADVPRNTELSSLSIDILARARRKIIDKKLTEAEMAKLEFNKAFESVVSDLDPEKAQELVAAIEAAIIEANQNLLKGLQGL